MVLKGAFVWIRGLDFITLFHKQTPIQVCLCVHSLIDLMCAVACVHACAFVVWHAIAPAGTPRLRRFCLSNATYVRKRFRTGVSVCMQNFPFVKVVMVTSAGRDSVYV